MGNIYGGNNIRKVSPVNTVIIIINVLVFIGLSVIGNPNDAEFMYYHGACYPPAIVQGHEYYRLLTCAFIHFNVSHILNNMIVLGYIGDNLERAIGSIRYAVFYLLAAVGSSLVSLGWHLLAGENSVSGGASGAIFGVVGALLVIVIRNKGQLEDLSSRRLALFAVFSIYLGVTSVGTDNAAHIGGFLVGAVLSFFFYRKRRAW